ncbi:hypothetical protein LZ32DRAFT_610527 [Colletotrichum eremochloae]|nr:hypothetical protein LZ32DRAFT_610527 [Colletotrichum eremochloae]
MHGKLKDVLVDIVADDVPFITTAGNYGEDIQEAGRFPAAAVSKLPITVVGSVETSRMEATESQKDSTESQRGRMVTTHACG